MERMPPRAEDLAVCLRRGVVAVAAAAALAVSACAAPGGGATTAPTTQALATTVPETAAPPTASGESLQLILANDTTLGSYVTGRDGKSLYIFTKDHDDTSTCNGDCAASWPPATVTMADDANAGTGVTGTLGTITRDDGSMQLTLGGHPVYYFGGDKAAGDTNGQGVGEVWFLAGPDGAGLGMGGGAVTDGPKVTPCPPADRTCY
jgi:predicted lipoprotein with Yx(FWY)xxD motif